MTARRREALDAVGGWYADFHSDAEVAVAFSGRAFPCRGGDSGERVKVADYARAVGVPEAQRDWADEAGLFAARVRRQ